MSLLLGFTNWKQICAISEIQIENRMPFYKSKSGLWQSWITVPKHDSVLQVYIRPVTKLNYSSKTWFSFSGQKQICAKIEIQIFPSTCKTLLFQVNFLGNKMESHLLHVCFQTLWNIHEPRFCNRHVCYQGLVVTTRKASSETDLNYRICFTGLSQTRFTVCKFYEYLCHSKQFTDFVKQVRNRSATESVCY